MAKRSDFAQKLLDDLRLRKERMASSQRSNQSHHLPVDAYAYTKQTYRGSRNTKANEIVSSRSEDMLNRSCRNHSRSVSSGQVSNQLVPYGKGQSSEPTGDLSLALAFAFENGGKLRRNDSIMGFLHQIKRGRKEFSVSEGGGSNSDRQLASTSHYPTLSPLQINEISRGAQKLNQILRACSNGLNMDTYPIQFAKELLRGAIDLEESLRMLVELQKGGTSEFMLTPPKKNQITLLEEDNDDDNATRMETSEKMQLARPTFSFDKTSRHTQHIQQVGKAFFMQRPVTFTNSMESRNSNNEKRNVKIQVSQKRSTKSASDIKNAIAISERKNQTASVSVQPNLEKGRIPNVIAKLMGLDNLPEKVELESKHLLQKDLVVTQKIEGNGGMCPYLTAKGSTEKIELKNKQKNNLIPMKNQKVIEAFRMPATQDEELMFGVDKNFLVQKTSSEVVAQNGKPLWRDVDGIKALKGFDKTSINITQHNKSSAKKHSIRETHKDVQVNGRKQDYPNNSNREQKGTAKGRTHDLVLNNMLAQLEQVHERSQVKASIQEEKEINGSIVQLEKRNTNKPINILNNEKKSRNHLEAQKSYVVSKGGPQEEKHGREQQLQVREEHMLMIRPRGRSDMVSKNSSKPPPQLINSLKKELSINQAALFKKNSGENFTALRSDGHYVDHDIVRDQAPNNTKEKVKGIINRKLGQISSPRDRQLEGANGVKSLMDEKDIYNKLASKKTKTSRKQRVEMPGNGKIDQVLTGRNRGKLITKQGKQQIPSLQEARQRGEPDELTVMNEAEQEKVSMSRFADAVTVNSNEPVVVAMAEPLDVEHQSHKEDELPLTLPNSDGGRGELQRQQELVALFPVPNDLHYQQVPSVAVNMRDQAVPEASNEGSKVGKVALHEINGIQQVKMCMNHSQLQNQNDTEISIQQPLTETENCLKWILVMSQLFVNTAESLFRLKIPSGVLQGGVQDNQEEGSKLILDCGYEVMKRKGIRQELKVHCCSKMPMGSMNIISLDDLVRQLNKDMEKLKFYGRKRSSQVDVENYLPKMLEHDVYDKDPDIDCMWDLGWNDETFAFIEKYDVIRDTEKYILNLLLDEITGDFCKSKEDSAV